jgi:hypothetical protein
MTEIDKGDDATLLRPLYQIMGRRPFDGTTIEHAVIDGAWPRIAPDSPRLNAVKVTHLALLVEQSPLYAALQPIEPKLVKTGWRAGRLSQRTRTRLRNWLDQVEGRSLGGLMLTRDRLGWCRVEPEVGHV